MFFSLTSLCACTVTSTTVSLLPLLPFPPFYSLRVAHAKPSQYCCTLAQYAVFSSAVMKLALKELHAYDHDHNANQERI